MCLPFVSSRRLKIETECRRDGPASFSGRRRRGAVSLDPPLLEFLTETKDNCLLGELKRRLNRQSSGRFMLSSRELPETDTLRVRGLRGRESIRWTVSCRPPTRDHKSREAEGGTSTRGQGLRRYVQDEGEYSCVESIHKCMCVFYAHTFLS